MRKGTIAAVLVSMLAAGPVLAATAAPAPEAPAAPAKAGKPSAKKRSHRHVQHRGSHGVRRSAAESVASGSAR